MKKGRSARPFSFRRMRFSLSYIKALDTGLNLIKAEKKYNYQ